MKLIELELCNYCNHKFRKVEFGAGLTAILGPNGAGKSNFIDGVYFPLTGESRNDGNKSENICQLAGDTEKSYAKLKFEHAGTVATIVRSLRPNSSLMTIGSTTFRKSVEIERTLESVLGISKKVLSDFIFVPQKGLDGLLSLGASDRAAAFQRLFGTWKLEKCYKLVTDKIGELPKVQLIRNDTERLTEEVTNLKNRINQLSGMLAQYFDLPEGWEPSTSSDHIKLENYKRLDSVKSKLSELVNQQEIVQEEIDDTTHKISRLENEIKQLTADLTAMGEEHKLAEYNLIKWQEYQEYEQEVARYEKKISDLKAVIESLVAPPMPTTYLDIESSEFEERYLTLSSELTHLKKFVSAFNPDTGVGSCPECGTEACELKDKWEESNSRLPKLEEELKTLSVSKRDSKKYLEDEKKYKFELSNKTFYLNQFYDRKDKIPKVSRPSISAEYSKEIIGDYHLIKKEIVANENVLNSFRLILEQKIKYSNFLHTQITQNQNEIKRIDLTEDQAKELEAKCKKNFARFQNKIWLQAERTGKEQRLKELNEDLTQSMAIASKMKKIGQWTEKLESVRAVLHRDALPKMLSDHYLSALEEEVNDTLEELNAAFRIKRGEDLNLRAVFPDGRDVQVQRLSGAEKAICSIALRVVVNSTFAGEVGLLCLDEPTDGLDSDNLKCLETALGRLKQLSQNLGLQVLLVTHEHRLAPLFDHTITL